MVNRYAIGSTATATAPTRYTARAAKQLSDGTLVYLRSDGAATPTYSLCYSTDRATEVVIAALPRAQVGVAAAGISPSADRGIALAVDDQDNLFVVSDGANLQYQVGSDTVTGINSVNGALWVFPFAKGTGRTWSAQKAVGYNLNANDPITETTAQWCATGGGRTGRGHLLYTGWRPTGSLQLISLDAGDLAAGIGSLGSSGDATSATTGTGTANGAGKHDACPDGFGGTTVMISYHSPSVSSRATVRTFSVGSNGAITASSAVVDVTGYACNIARVASDRWLILLAESSPGTASSRLTYLVRSSTAQVLAPNILAAGSPTNMPASWAVDRLWNVWTDYATPSRIWAEMLGTPSGASLPLWRTAFTWDGSAIALSTAATADSPITIGATGSYWLSTVRQPRSARFVDFQVSYPASSTPTYSAAGDAIITNTAPTAPTLTIPAAGSVVDRTQPITLAWAFSDPDPGDSQSKADLRYRVSGASTWTTVLGATSTGQSYTLTAGSLSAAQWEWQVATYDALGAASPWSASGFFTAANPPSAPTITDPVNGGTINGSVYTATWSASQQDAYEVRRLADSAGSPDTGTVYSTTGVVEDASGRSRTLTFSTNNRVEHVQVRVRYQGIWSSWGSSRATVSYTPPPTPSAVLTPSDATASILVSVTNPASSGQQPTVSSVDLYVDDGFGEGLTRRAVGITPNSSWTYWVPASGVDYSAGRVKVVAVAGNGTTSEALAT